jgi:predicted MFS family arabinose efflux permease
MRPEPLLLIALLFAMVVGIAAGELIFAMTDTRWTFFLGLAIGIPVWLVVHDLVTRRRRE